jgi:hypothetical protein
MSLLDNLNVSDDSLISRLLNGYVQIEQSKIDSRLAASDPSTLHYPAQPQDAQANAGSYTAQPGSISPGLLVVLAAAGLLVYSLAK